MLPHSLFFVVVYYNMKSKKLDSILVVGLGSIGKRHLKNILALGYRNVSGVEPDKKTAAAIKKEFSIPIYDSLKEGLKNAKPDAVFVCSPTHLHISNAAAALRAGAHVFIEKPLSVNLKGVDNLIRSANKNKKIVMVACNYLFYKGFQELKRILDSGVYGKPLFARATVGYYLPSARKNSNYKNLYAARKNQGGGVILDSGSHVVNYLSALLGPVVKNRAVAGRSRLLGIQSEESAALVLEHVGGILSTASLDYLSKKPVHRLEVVTDQGLLTLDIKEDNLVFESDKKKKIVYRGNRDTNQMFLDELKHFFHCLQKKEKPIQDLEEAKETLKILV